MATLLNSIKGVKGWVTKHLLVIIFLLIVVFGFYWYEMRPWLAIKKCQGFAEEQAIQELKREKGNKHDKGTFRESDYESLYKRCLRVKGIGK